MTRAKPSTLCGKCSTRYFDDAMHCPTCCKTFQDAPAFDYHRYRSKCLPDLAGVGMTLTRGVWWV